ncbi:MAG: hypothetical protein GXO74_00590 [Calditrichaeota bacterium]|nr:hypothetical protein [Calditrichota bacterium]
MDEKELLNMLEIFAHKMRNPLHAAMINLDVAKVKCEKTAADKAISKHLQIAGNEVQSIHRLTERFIEYVKLPEKKRNKIDLRKFLSK